MNDKMVAEELMKIAIMMNAETSGSTDVLDEDVLKKASNVWRRISQSGGAVGLRISEASEMVWQELTMNDADRDKFKTIKHRDALNFLVKNKSKWYR